MKPSVRLSRSWNLGPESHWMQRKVTGKTQDQAPVDERKMEPSLETQVLRARSWEPTAATRACRHERIVSDRHGYPLV
jgi:hypothetical protein